jgi:glucoamylase
MTLRVVDTERFKMMYSTDGWKTSVTLESRPVGYAGFFVDIPTVEGQGGTIGFTFYWPGQDKWLGRNFEVVVE